MEVVAKQEIKDLAKVYHGVVLEADQKLNGVGEHDSWSGRNNKTMYRYQIKFEDGFVGIYNSEFSNVHPPSFPVGENVCYKITSLAMNTIMPCKEPEAVNQSAQVGATPGAPPPNNTPKQTTYHSEPTNAISSIQSSLGYLSLRLAVDASAGRHSTDTILKQADLYKQYILDNRQ